MAFKSWYKTKRGVIFHIYSGQRERNKKKFGCEPEYTRSEFYDYCMLDPGFNVLFSEWVKSGYKKMKRPSIDRIDNAIGYSFDNIQVMTWQENYDKEQSSRSNKRAVLQYNLDGIFIREFESAKEVKKVHPYARVSDVCKGKRKSTYGFVYKYKRI